jgi:pimeloyl-ACP methyl ester carboxylesterase
MMRSKWILSLLLGAVAIGLWASRADAKDYVVPLHDGKVKVKELNAAISDELHVISLPTSTEIDLNSPEGADFLCAVNACLWDGCSLQTTRESAVLKLVPPVKGTCNAMRRMTRIIAAERAPIATAAQARRWGLNIPDQINGNLPLVVLVHGLDADQNDCAPLGNLLRASGYQVAYFSYPGDQPIEDSAAMLATSMRILHDHFPNIRVRLVCHSMGGLVARRYVEGPKYAGGVDRLIMVGTPNHGSSWAHFRTALSVQEHYYLRADPDWAWTWLITEGMGEAGDDLLPGSDFLKDLNAHPRRDGVKYTIIAGNKSGVDKAEANVVDSVADWMPTRARNWWGFRHCYHGLVSVATHLRDKTSDGDGPVSLKSAKLKGVKDFVVLPADHVTLFIAPPGHEPVALGTIRERLKG